LSLRAYATWIVEGSRALRKSSNKWCADSASASPGEALEVLRCVQRALFPPSLSLSRLLPLLSSHGRKHTYICLGVGVWGGDRSWVLSPAPARIPPKAKRGISCCNDEEEDWRSTPKPVITFFATRTPSSGSFFLSSHLNPRALARIRSSPTLCKGAQNRPRQFWQRGWMNCRCGPRLASPRLVLFRLPFIF